VEFRELAVWVKGRSGLTAIVVSGRIGEFKAWRFGLEFAEA
jgi:hypothetical protein